MGSLDQSSDEVLVRTLFEKGPLKSKTLADDLDLDQLEEQDVEDWAQDAAARGIIEPSEAIPGAWQVTDAGRRLIGNEPGR